MNTFLRGTTRPVVSTLALILTLRLAAMPVSAGSDYGDSADVGAVRQLAEKVYVSVCAYHAYVQSTVVVRSYAVATVSLCNGFHGSMLFVRVKDGWAQAAGGHPFVSQCDLHFAGTPDDVVAELSARAGIGVEPYPLDRCDFGFFMSGTNLVVSFHSPSGKDGCALFGDTRQIRCDIAGGLTPAPTKPNGCHATWAVGYQLDASHGAMPVCASDTAIGIGPVLEYGASWTSADFKCTSQTTGLSCTNQLGEGFTLADGQTRSFTSTVIDGFNGWQHFGTPKREVACAYVSQMLRCDVAGGIVPPPPNRRDCAYTMSYVLDGSVKGHGHIECTSDTGTLFDRDPGPVLPYGRSVTLGALLCASSEAGLTCTNPQGRGFFLSRKGSHSI